METTQNYLGTQIKVGETFKPHLLDKHFVVLTFCVQNYIFLLSSWNTEGSRVYMIDCVSMELSLSCDVGYWKGFLKLWTTEHKSEKQNQDSFVDIIVYIETLSLWLLLYISDI